MQPPYILVIDFETSGVDIRENKSQPISCGAVVVDTATLKAVSEIYLECEFHLDRFEWNTGAEKIHGLSVEHLQKAPTMKEAAGALLEFLLPYFKQKDFLIIVGHNPHFDGRCLDLWMKEIGVTLRQGHRKIDTFSIGFGLFGAMNSDTLFEIVGVKRSAHNALEDAQATLAALQLARKVGTIYQAIKDDPEMFNLPTR
jgi:DNA polymerase III epsilon subunit-like protein